MTQHQSTAKPQPTSNKTTQDKEKDAQEWYEAACEHVVNLLEQGHRFGIPLWAIRKALLAQLESERYVLITTAGQSPEKVDAGDEEFKLLVRAGLPKQFEQIKKAAEADKAKQDSLKTTVEGVDLKLFLGKAQ